jgi:DNA replication protein DnaC
MGIENEIANLLSGFKAMSNEQADQLIAERTESVRRTRAKELMVQSNAPLRHARTHADVAAWGESYVALRKLVGTGMFSIVIGPRGTGKTQLGVELMRAAAASGHQPKFVTGTEIGLMLKDSFHEKAQRTESQVIASLESPRLLVVDEWDKVKTSEYTNAVLFELLNTRYNKVRDTIIISNHDRNGIVQSLGESLVSRVQECGVLVELTNKSFREAKQ